MTWYICEQLCYHSEVELNQFYTKDGQFRSYRGYYFVLFCGSRSLVKKITLMMSSIVWACRLQLYNKSQQNKQ